MKLGVIELILLLPFIALYFLPTIIVLVRKTNNSILIILLNILLGWTFLGWIGALIWAFTSSKQPSNTLDDLLDSSSKK